MLWLNVGLTSYSYVSEKAVRYECLSSKSRTETSVCLSVGQSVRLSNCKKSQIKQYRFSMAGQFSIDKFTCVSMMLDSSIA